MHKRTDNIRIDYTNEFGKRSIRTVRPTGQMALTSNERFPVKQWFIEVIDMEDPELTRKYFALENIHSWEPEYK